MKKIQNSEKRVQKQVTITALSTGILLKEMASGMSRRIKYLRLFKSF
jgi:hypothetical protein